MKPTIKTYRCENDLCHFKQKTKRRKVLFKGLVVDPSYVIARCDSCGKDTNINVFKEELDEKPVDVRQLLKIGRKVAER